MDGKSTEDDVKNDVAAGVGDGFPSIDNLLLELVEERIVVLNLLLLLTLTFRTLPMLLFLHLKAQHLTPDKFHLQTSS